ncbi:SCO family protein [Elongatibacter sediminis]|uniref:SCO family protein n=1 Tax=Elongatibacter sediminis TaxID=3119006 RepID=A0AAW9R5H9_9GAMM
MPATSRNLTALLLAFSLAVLGLLGGALAWRVFEHSEPPATESLIVLPEPRIVADFDLRDQRGEPFSLQDLRGRWSVLFFGFTSCPDVCPNTLFQLHQVRSALLETLGPDEVPEIYLVSVDPERDTPDKLASYLEHFDPAFKGVTGDDAQLRALTLQLGAMYHVAPHDPGDTAYQVDHSASLMLLDPEGRLYGVLPAPHVVDHIIADLTEVLNNSGSG